MRLVLMVLVLLCCGCISTPRRVEILATDEITPDYDTYHLRRLALVPFTGDLMGAERAAALQSAFFTEFSRATPYEIVPLQASDLEEIPTSDPYRRGRYDGRTVINVARRYRLDGVLVGTVTDEQLFPPQRLSVQVDLVAAETGLAIWSASVHLDARDDRVLRGLRDLHRRSAPADGDGWEVGLISPSRFAQFAAFQVSHLLGRLSAEPAQP